MRVSIVGALGRMGRELIELVAADSQLELVSATLSPSDVRIGHSLSQYFALHAIDVAFTKELTPQADVIIDFSTPAASIEHVAFAAKHHIPIVLGTTGFTPAQINTIKQCSQHCVVFHSPNMSIGVSVLWRLLDVASQMLAPMADIDIVDSHHRHKLDAPSGTALKMGEIVAKSLGANLSDLVYDAAARGDRPANKIGFSVRRAGETVGEHAAIFEMPSEQITIEHRATDRKVFARGALQAAKWIHVSALESGWHTMDDFFDNVMQKEPATA